jgi:hypothetical protein
MNLPRRRFLHLAAGSAPLRAASRIARAQTYPTKSSFLLWRLRRVALHMSMRVW